MGCDVAAAALVRNRDGDGNNDGLLGLVLQRVAAHGVLVKE